MTDKYSTDSTFVES